MHVLPRPFLLVALLVGLVSCAGTSGMRHAAAPVLATQLSVFTKQSEIAEACSERTVRRKGVAGFEMLAGSKEAFEARIAVVEAARHTLDFQYFIWRDDVTGTVFADRLLAAADRGVKVRMLLDVTFGAQYEVRTATLAAHPNIEIAFFNPMTKLSGIFVGNPIPIVGELDRMQSRMHNKLIVADDTIMISGGRNLGDEYFGISGNRNMRDMDYVAVGPVVKAATKSFNLYWQSTLTHHGDPAKLTARDHKRLRNMRDDIADKKRRLVRRNDCPYTVAMTRGEALSHLQKLSSRLIWTEYQFVVDPPERMLRQGRIASPVWRSLEEALAGSEKKVVMHAAYLIPQRETLDLFHEVTGKGVEVTILTNSLASVDGLPAMAGIQKRRGDVLDAGVTLYELNGHAPSRKTYIHGRKMTPMGMHTKAVTVDDKVSFIGSYNMDPRSQYINTETGVIIHSPAFAARLNHYLEEDLQPENSWGVTRDPKGGFLWTSKRPGKKPLVKHHDPGAPITRHVETFFLRHLPWEDLL